LITEGEGIVRTPHDKILVLHGNGIKPDWLYEKIEELRDLAHQQNAPGIKAKLQEIVPEYRPFDLQDCGEISEALASTSPTHISRHAKKITVDKPVRL